MSKQSKQNGNRKNSKELGHLDLDTVNAASSTDMTGLIPANPKSQAELDSYEEVYDIENDLPNDLKQDRR